MASPKTSVFKQVVIQKRGNLSRVAEHFGVNRTTVYDWIKNNPKFQNIIDDARMRLFDDCLVTSEVVAMGVPDRDSDGRIIGWKERPDSNMLRYLMSTLGRKEGFGESIDVTSGGEKISARVLTPKEIKDLYESLDKDF